MSRANWPLLVAAAVRDALEARESEPTGLHRHRRIEDDARDLRRMRGWWSTTAKTLGGIVLVSTVVGAIWAGCLAVRDEMDRAVTAQVAPVRQDVAEIQRDMREVLRRLPDKEARP